METEKIEFYKVRDLGDRINVTFKFIKQNGKCIARNFIYLIPVYIIAAILTGIFQGAIYTQSYYGYDNSNIANAGFVGLLSLSMLAVSITSYIGTMFVIAYIAEYEESEDGIVDSSKAWKRVKQTFWGGIGGAFIVFIAIFIGFLFCFLPGIWLAVSFSLFLSIYVIEKNKPVSLTVVDSIGESFNLIKTDWFGSFGYYFVMGCIAGAFYFALYMPAMIVNSLSMLTPNGGVLMIVLSSITNSVYYIGILFVYAISTTSTAMLYFDLKERTSGLSLQKKIDNIGQTEL